MSGRKIAEFGQYTKYRLLTESFEANPRRYVRLQERDDDRGWETIGYAELHPSLGADREGRLAEDGVAFEWSGPYCHRHHHRHRLTVATATRGVLVVRHEQRTSDRYGDGGEEPAWRLVAGWRLTSDTVDGLDGGASA